VVCSNCGAENPAANRFCGMCGTPLPQRPITAPVAQSTLSFTRLPGGAPSTAGSSFSSTGGTQSTTAVEEKPAPTNSSSGATAHGGKNYFAQAEQAESLEQFVAGFQYTPPAEEEELTMTGAKPVLDSTAKYEPVSPMALSDEPPQVEEPIATQQAIPQEPTARAVEPSLNTPPPMAMPKKPRAPQPSAAVPEATGRPPGFLDISEAPKPEEPAEYHPSIGGPSFPGLSDEPPGVASDEFTEPAGRSHWRAWVALLVVLIFAALGFLEWRAERHQTNSGPIGVMKMQIERLKRKKGAVVTPVTPTDTTPDGSPAGSTPAAQPSNPNQQVAPGQQPQNTAPAPNPADKPTSPNPGAASNSATPPVTQPTAAGADQDQPANAAPGAEELDKAKTVSDGAAAAAWLWKAVGKGNPEAPVQLADLYIKGDGVPHNCDQALVLLRVAAANENAAARSRLGTLYATGTCVARDRVRAYEYLSSAVEANPNAVWARNFRQHLWTQMTPQERNLVKKYR
jgi:hypothetical protein